MGKNKEHLRYITGGRIMKEFIDELYEYSLKYLTKDEAKDLISFYEEIIS